MNKDLIMLIAEDQYSQRRTVVQMLRSLGISTVLEASNGVQALTLIREAEPALVDIVLIDLEMPEMDGMELIRHLGSAASTSTVVILSAKEPALLASVGKMALAYKVRLLGVIEKPITRDKLKDVLIRHQPFVPKPEWIANDTPVFSIDEIMHGMQQREFEPFFQPKIDLTTGNIIGAEALARWRHPDHDIVCPYAFITTLEQNGKINKLTFQMLELAAQACCQWRANGYDWGVSVNLSLASLSDPMLADSISSIVRLVGLDPSFMTLEISESAAMANVASGLENLARLRMHGFELSIDDYGTGYASMQQLTRIPFTELKIDQGFVTGCVDNHATRAIVESSVSMARSLGIKSVAEGVETQTDWDVLKDMNCDVAQGYFIAKPMDAGSFLKFCSEYQPSPPLN